MLNTDKSLNWGFRAAETDEKCSHVMVLFSLAVSLLK